MAFEILKLPHPACLDSPDKFTLERSVPLLDQIPIAYNTGAWKTQSDETIRKAIAFNEAENVIPDMEKAHSNEYFYLLMDFIRLVAIRHITGDTTYKLPPKEKLQVCTKDLQVYRKVLELKAAARFFRRSD